MTRYSPTNSPREWRRGRFRVLEPPTPAAVPAFPREMWNRRERFTAGEGGEHLQRAVVAVPDGVLQVGHCMACGGHWETLVRADPLAAPPPPNSAAIADNAKHLAAAFDAWAAPHLACDVRPAPHYVPDAVRHVADVVFRAAKADVEAGRFGGGFAHLVTKGGEVFAVPVADIRDRERANKGRERGRALAERAWAAREWARRRNSELVGVVVCSEAWLSLQPEPNPNPYFAVEDPAKREEIFVQVRAHGCSLCQGAEIRRVGGVVDVGPGVVGPLLDAGARVAAAEGGEPLAARWGSGELGEGLYLESDVDWIPRATARGATAGAPRGQG